MKNASIAAVLFVSCALCSCKENVVSGRGSIGSDQRSTGNFTSIEIAVPLKASITVDPAGPASLKFSGYSNVLKYIKTEVVNNKLRIYTDPGIRVDGQEYLNAEISVPMLSAVSMEGAPDADIHGNITGKDFTISISGASNINIDEINTTGLEADLSGSGDIRIKQGNVQHAEYTVSGAGDIKAYGLHSMETTATVSGVGDIQVTAEQKLDATISGAGGIKYKGHPVITTQTSGVGSIEDGN